MKISIFFKNLFLKLDREPRDFISNEIEFQVIGRKPVGKLNRDFGFNTILFVDIGHLTIFQIKQRHF